MAKMGDIEIKFSREVRAAVYMVISTRMVTCWAAQCRYNTLELTCSRKEIFLNTIGQCDKYDPYEEKEE